jgi:hypothetical protein
VGQFRSVRLVARPDCLASALFGQEHEWQCRLRQQLAADAYAEDHLM